MSLIKPQYTLNDFNYDLPGELIAQFPLERRDASRLFVLNRTPQKFIHTVFNRIGDFLKDDDILVFNDARVLKARIHCRRESGGKVEVVLAERIDLCTWHIICNRTARIKKGERLYPEKNPGYSFAVEGRSGEYLIIKTDMELDEALLDEIGEVPLPPYIRRDARAEDSDRYQTVYSSKAGAVASPTAGLHFTGEIIENLKSRGIETVFTTLYVSWGTFSPVRENDLSMHKMHSEKYILDEKSADIINSGRKAGRRIVCVGTTALRVLEATYNEGENHCGEGYTDIFIYPPYKIRSVDVLLTNLHTPGSTLLMLVSTFSGYNTVMDAYREAVNERYRFFSYGDAMLIL